MFRLSVPSKTFIVGEYAALQGAPALLLNTSPRFSLTAIKILSGLQESEVTPVMKELSEKMDLNQYQLEFYDPHEGRGGFGASGAELLLLVALRKVLDRVKIKPFELLEEIEGLKEKIGWSLGSGYDVLSQMCGAVVYVERNSRTIETSGWPFPEIGWVLLRGETKIPTHEHLASLKSQNFGQLGTISRQAARAFLDKEEMAFVQGVRDYYGELIRQDLVAANVQERVNEIRGIEGVLAAKGCGALGVDVTLVLYRRRQEDEVLSEISDRFDIVESTIGEGLTVESLQ